MDNNVAHRRLVYHEAAHALVGTKIGGNVKQMTLSSTRNAGCDLCNNIYFKVNDDLNEGFIDEAACLLAGALGEHLSQPGAGIPPWSENDPATWPGATEDWAEITKKRNKQLPDADPELVDELIDCAIDMAWDTLTKNEAVLHCLAEGLTEKQFLRDWEVRLISNGLSPRAVAYHEAGHALVATLIGTPVESVALDTPEPITTFESEPSNHATGIIAHAGCLASYLAVGSLEKPPWYGDSLWGWHGGMGDFANCSDAWARIAKTRGLPEPSNTDPDWANGCKDRAWKLLTENVALLHRLAQDLLDRARLTGDEVTEIGKTC